MADKGIKDNLDFDMENNLKLINYARYLFLLSQGAFNFSILAAFIGCVFFPVIVPIVSIILLISFGIGFAFLLVRLVLSIFTEESSGLHRQGRRLLNKENMT